jgi:hypothetical protein
LAHAGIAIQADDQHVAQFARLLQATNVARVQQIEAAVGENHAAGVAFLAAKPQNCLIQSENARIQKVSQSAR